MKYMTLCVMLFASLAWGQDPWPMAGLNAQRTSRFSDYGPFDGTLEWSFGIYSPDCRGGLSVASDGRVYIGTDNNAANVNSFTSNGALSWSYTFSRDIDIVPALGTSSVYFAGGHIVAATDDRIESLSKDGAFQWSYDIGDLNYQHSIALDASENLYMGCNDMRLYSIGSSGALNWSYATAGAINADCALGYTGNVYFGSKDANAYALDSAGALLWSYTASPTTEGRGASVDADENIYIPQSWMRKYNSAGALLWNYNSSGGNTSVAIGVGGEVYFGTTANRMLCLLSDGSLSWSYNSPNDFNGAPAIDNNGIIYTAGSGTNGDIWAFNSNGTMRWSYKQNDASGWGVAPGVDITLSRGTMYVPSYDNNVYVFRSLTPTPTVAPTVTPTPTITPTPRFDTRLPWFAIGVPYGYGALPLQLEE